MPTTTFTLKKKLQAPTDFSQLLPEEISKLTMKEISSIIVAKGNRKKRIRDLFNIKCRKNGEENILEFRGDLSSARRIGFQMRQGLIKIYGKAGLYLGEALNGGTIIVEGDTGSWTGTRMKDGLIEVKGNAEHFLGSSYRGSREGLSGGKILVHGNAGDETGSWQTNGFIHIKGSVNQFTGIHMKGGTILIEKECGFRTGAEMTSGTIIALGKIEQILPSFSIYDIRNSITINDKTFEGPFYVFEGDVNESGKGRIYAFKEKNIHLAYYEKYLGKYE